MESIIYPESSVIQRDKVCFYTISDLVRMTGWSKPTVIKLFNHPKFPATDFGKQKVIEEQALIKFFSVRRDKASDPYWNNIKE